MKSVCIDGYNIAMPRGSGIATYGRNLVGAIDDIGLKPQILYGPAEPRSSDGLVNAAAIVDAPPKRGRFKKWDRYRQTALARFGRHAFRVQQDDRVISPVSAEGSIATTMQWSSQHLFTVAGRAFQKYRTITPVTFEPDRDAVMPSIMHWTCPLPLQAKGMANLFTFHDLIPLRLPFTTQDDKGAYTALCRSAAERADHIVVVSETTRRDVIELLGVPEHRVTNTYQAVSLPAELVARPLVEVEADVERVLGLGWQGYYLYFGAVEPKKNLARIIEAHLGSGVSAPLVIVGGRGWLDADETAFLNQIAANPDAGVSSRIRQFEYMPFPLLVSLIRGARAVLFPSLYEGFGLPVLEAMLLGTPVLTSTAGSLPEVAGDAAIMVDPYDVDAIRRGIRTIDADAGLREHLSAQGRIRAETFSPAAYRDRLTKLYGKIGA